MKETAVQQLTDEDYIDLCLALAKNGIGAVSPNPIVGAIVLKKGKIIGQGYHAFFGGPHAEVYAIRNATQPVAGATLYVNLEPCSITGKTPPCTDLIIQSGIREVVVGTNDPNPRIAGRGIRLLQKAGIRVTTGIRKKECSIANESFFKYITTGIPFVALKIAQTLDGKIADIRGKSKWITGIESRTMTHELRSRFDGILVGAGTIHTDDSRLTVRLVHKRSPYRIVLDGRFTSPPSARVFRDQDKSRTIILCDKTYLNRSRNKKRELERRGVMIKPFTTRRPGLIGAGEILRYLGSRGISSLLVEGGAQIFSMFLTKQHADKLYTFIAPKIFGTGKSPFEKLEGRDLPHAIHLADTTILKIHDDLLIEGYLKTDKS